MKPLLAIFLFSAALYLCIRIGKHLANKKKNEDETDNDYYL